MSLIVVRVEGDQAVSVDFEGRREAPVQANPIRELIRLAALQPAAHVAWLDRRLEPGASDPQGWPGLLRHDLEVLHAGGSDRMAASLGLVDFDSPWLLQAPQDRRFATWLISPLAGIARAAAFRAVGLDSAAGSLAAALFDFGLRGARQGLCPVVEPGLLRAPGSAVDRPLRPAEIARLIRRGYGRRWVGFWLLASLLTRRGLPWIAALRGRLAASAPIPDQAALDALRPALPGASDAAVDVLIPTLARPGHLRALLEDLAHQSLLPRRVIVVDQGGAPPALTEVRWPFELRLLSLSRPGACRARNAGLREVRGDWVLLLDDDVRLRPGLIERLVKVARAYGVEAVNASVHLPDQRPTEESASPRLWPAFSSGAALVAARPLLEIGGFDERLDGGYGEDYEIGVRLRLHGASILFDAAEPVLHLKAPDGGLRHPLPLPWEAEPVAPRPSPMVLYSRRKHLTPEMRDGYRLYYSLKRLGGAPPWRWPADLRRMRRQWERSEHWAGQLLESPGESV